MVSDRRKYAWNIKSRAVTKLNGLPKYMAKLHIDYMFHQMVNNMKLVVIQEEDIDNKTYSTEEKNESSSARVGDGLLPRTRHSIKEEIGGKVVVGM